ncbi:hypothetical protein BHE74_00039514 [Ensete ventricosum]|nr:hypothetical protein BHE74_00039514 [Ensete ventricosum]
MLRPGVTRERVGEGEMPGSEQKSEMAEALRYMVRVTGELDCFSAHIRLREPGKSEDKAELANNCLENIEVLKQVVERGEEATTNPEGLSYSKAECQLKRRWTRKSVIVPQRRTHRLRRKGCRCKATDSRAMGSTAPWYRKGGTSVESSIPCSHGGRALVVKGVEEVENTEANSKYQDKAEGQRPMNFIRPVSTRFSLN